MIRWLNFSFHLQVVEILPFGKVQVALYPELQETMECQLGDLKELPKAAPKAWKSDKKSAYKVAKNF